MMDLQTLFILITILVTSLGIAAATWYSREYKAYRWLWYSYYGIVLLVCIMVSMGITALIGRMLGMVGP